MVAMATETEKGTGMAVQAAKKKTKVQKRVAGFLSLLASKLSQDDEDDGSQHGPGRSALSSCSPDDLRALLHRSILNLPAGHLRSALEEDLTAVVASLQSLLEVQHQRKTAETLTLATASSQKVKDDSFGSGIAALPNALCGSLFSDRAYMEVLNSLVAKCLGDGGSSSSHSEAWRQSAFKLLQARQNPPLQLLWAMAILDASPGERKNPNPSPSPSPSPSGASFAWLKFTVFGQNPNPNPTSVAALAPVLAIAFASLQKACKAQGKEAKRLLRDADKTCRELLSFLAISRFAKSGFLIDNGAPLSLAPSLAPSHSLAPAFACFSLLLRILKGEENLAEPEGGGGEGEREREKTKRSTDEFRSMFPLATKAKLKALQKPNAKVDLVAQVVVSELVLLHLLVKWVELRGGNEAGCARSEDTLQKLREIAVHDIAEAGAEHVDLLMAPRLPMENILNDQEEALLRGILYEASLVDEPKFGQASADPKKDGLFFFKKIAIARKAICLYRNLGERTRSISILERVSMFSVPDNFQQIFTSTKMKPRPDDSTLQNSKAFIGWLISLEDRGFQGLLDRLTSDDAVKLEVQIESKKRTPNQEEEEEAGILHDANAANQDLEEKSVRDAKGTVFFVDTEGQECEPNDQDAMETAFIVAASSIQGGKRPSKKEKRIVFHRHKPSRNTRLSQQSIAEFESDFSLSEDSDGGHAERNELSKKRTRSQQSISDISNDEEGDVDSDKRTTLDKTTIKSKKQAIHNGESAIDYEEDSEADGIIEE